MPIPVKKWGNGSIILAGCMLLLILLLGSLAKDQASAVKESDPVDAAGAQWDKLLALGTGSIHEEMKGTVKWQGDWNTLLAPEEAIGVLATRLGLSEVDPETVQDHEVYSAYGRSMEIRSKLTVTPVKEGTYYVILRLEGEGMETLKEMKSEQTVSGESLADEGVSIHWNAALQGTMKPENGGSPETGKIVSTSIEDRMQELEDYAAHALKMGLVENYKDADTVSRTYYIPDLPLSVISGGKTVSLQMAVHRNSETGMEELSLGSPLLTIEY